MMWCFGAICILFGKKIQTLSILYQASKNGWNSYIQRNPSKMDLQQLSKTSQVRLKSTCTNTDICLLSYFSYLYPSESLRSWSKISLFLISSRTLLLSKAHELLISHVQLTSTWWIFAGPSTFLMAMLAICLLAKANCGFRNFEAMLILWDLNKDP